MSYTAGPVRTTTPFEDLRAACNKADETGEHVRVTVWDRSIFVAPKTDASEIYTRMFPSGYSPGYGLFGYRPR